MEKKMESNNPRNLYQVIPKEQYQAESRTGLSITRAVGYRQFDVPSKKDIIWTEIEVTDKFFEDNKHADYLCLTIFTTDNNKITSYYKKIGKVLPSEKIEND
jgi:hypothetical protein